MEIMMLNNSLMLGVNISSDRFVIYYLFSVFFYLLISLESPSSTIFLPYILVLPCSTSFSLSFKI